VLYFMDGRRRDSCRVETFINASRCSARGAASTVFVFVQCDEACPPSFNIFPAAPSCHTRGLTCPAYTECANVSCTCDGTQFVCNNFGPGCNEASPCPIVLKSGAPCSVSSSVSCAGYASCGVASSFYCYNGAWVAENEGACDAGADATDATSDQATDVVNDQAADSHE